jgi:hypothetical protein
LPARRLASGDRDHHRHEQPAELLAAPGVQGRGQRGDRDPGQQYHHDQLQQHARYRDQYRRNPPPGGGDHHGRERDQGDHRRDSPEGRTEQPGGQAARRDRQ